MPVGCVPFIIIIIIININIIDIQTLGRFGQRPELSQATGMALVRCILDKFLGVVCHCFPHMSHYQRNQRYFVLHFTSILYMWP